MRTVEDMAPHTILPARQSIGRELGRLGRHASGGGPRGIARALVPRHAIPGLRR
jgi:hypothetical protein